MNLHLIGLLYGRCSKELVQNSREMRLFPVQVVIYSEINGIFVIVYKFITLFTQ